MGLRGNRKSPIDFIERGVEGEEEAVVACCSLLAACISAFPVYLPVLTLLTVCGTEASRPVPFDCFSIINPELH